MNVSKLTLTLNVSKLYGALVFKTLNVSKLALKVSRLTLNVSKLTLNFSKPLNVSKSSFNKTMINVCLETFRMSYAWKSPRDGYY